MTRDDLTLYLTRQYSTLAGVAGFADYDLAIDATFRQLGTAEADLPAATADDSLTADAQALADYYTLRAIWRTLSVFADVYAGDPKVSKARSQIFKNTEVLLAAALKQVPSNYPVESGDFAFGRVQLDILEPAYTGLMPYPYY